MEVTELVSTLPPVQTYDGTAKTLGDITVRYQGSLPSDFQREGYDLVYQQNVEVGTASLTLSFKGNYTGESLTRSFQVGGYLAFVLSGYLFFILFHACTFSFRQQKTGPVR